jgi:hypothetical protein
MFAVSSVDAAKLYYDGSHRITDVGSESLNGSSGLEAASSAL